MIIEEFLPKNIATTKADNWQIQTLRSIKEDVTPCCIPIINYEGSEVGHLEPITRKHIDDEGLIKSFVEWRNRNLTGWLDQRPVTHEGTRKWMSHVIDETDRMNFLIYYGRKLVGRCGLINLHREWHESDGLIRGEIGGGIFFMHQTQSACIQWLIDNLKQRLIVSKVLTSNTSGLNSAISLGYDEKSFQHVPIYRKSLQGGDLLTESGEQDELLRDVELCYLYLRKEDFEATHKSWYS